MKPATPRTAFALLVLAALACNLGASGAGQSPATPAVATVAPAAIATATPPLTPTQEPSPTPEPFSPPDPTPFVSGLAANLQARMASGEWTLEEGLVTTLKFLAGEVNIEAIGQAGVEIHSYAGTGVVRMARNYLQSGADEATKTELQRLITLILPDAETLKRFAQPAQAQSGSAHLARLNVQMEECRVLWAGGWPEGSTAVCFEYRTVEAAGSTYEIYYPLDWPADDPRRAFFEPTADAVQDSAETFSRFGAMPSLTTIVFTLLPDPEVPGAYAVTDQAEENGTCQVAILPPGTGLSEGAYKQTVAHELFHCFQFKDYWDQAADYSASKWWVEGTAEYFGNVVYPTVDAESEFWGDFDVNSIETALLDMDYENVVFFQYLANRVGDEGVLQLMESMPGSGGRSAQLTALAGYPDMENLFHSFAKAYLDGEILDTGGGFVGISPLVDRRRTFAASGAESIPTNRFVVTRALFIFPERTRHTITEEGTDGLLTAAKPLDADGWAALPEALMACEELVYLYTVTRVSASDGEQEVSIGSEVEEMEESEGCDRCVVGRWQLDTMSNWDAFVSLLPSETNTSLQSISGTVTAIFTAQGSLTVELDNLDTRYTQDFADTHVETHINTNGVDQYSWATDREAGTLFSLHLTSEVVHSGESTATTPNLTMTVPVQSPPTPLMSGVSLYQCSEDTLLIDSLTPSGFDGQYVTWNRISP